MSNDDDILNALGAMGQREGAANPDEEPLSPADEARLWAYLRGELREAEAAEVEGAIADDPRLSMHLAAMIRSQGSLDAGREAAVIDHALGSLNQSAASEGEAAPSWLTQLRRWWAQNIPLPMTALAGVALMVLIGLWARWEDRPQGPLPQYTVSLSGEQKLWQGSDPASSPQTLPVFGPTSQLRLLLKPDVEGAPVEIVAWAVWSEGQGPGGMDWHRLTQGGPAKVSQGPGGILLQGSGRALFGDSAGAIEVVMAVGLSDDIADLLLIHTQPLTAWQRLHTAEEEGRIRVATSRLRYETDATP